MGNKSYYVFDVDGFFRDYQKNKRLLRDLEWELAQAITLKGTDYAKPKVAGGLPSSPVEETVEKISVLRAKITDLSDFFATADKYLNALTKRERKLAESYFVKGKKSRLGVAEVADELGISIASAYRMIRVIRIKIRQKEIEGA